MFNINQGGTSYEVKFAHLPIERVVGKIEKYIPSHVDRNNISMVTVCAITEIDYRENKNVYTGLSMCYHKDIFDKTNGRRRALTRALEDARLLKPMRTKIWDEYLSILRKGSQ